MWQAQPDFRELNLTRMRVLMGFFALLSGNVVKMEHLGLIGISI